jgi:hypothetical protein
LTGQTGSGGVGGATGTAGIGEETATCGGGGGVCLWGWADLWTATCAVFAGTGLVAAETGTVGAACIDMEQAAAIRASSAQRCEEAGELCENGLGMVLNVSAALFIMKGA